MQHIISNKSLAMRGPTTYFLFLGTLDKHCQLSLLNNSVKYINQGDFYGN